MAASANIEYFGDKGWTMVMSDTAAMDYKTANTNITACKVLESWPAFSMTKPNDQTTPPVIGGAGSTGEYANYSIVG